MPSLIRHITFDVAPPHEPSEPARFWAEVVGEQVHPDDVPGEDEVGLTGEPMPLFIRVPEAKAVKNRLHLDLEPAGTRDAEVQRLTALGATVVGDRRRPGGKGWVVPADPTGNEFCVERGAAEKA